MKIQNEAFQKGESISALCGVNTLPIPHLQTFTPGGIGKSAQKQQNGNKTFVDTANLQMQTKVSQIQGTRREMDDNIVNLKNKDAKFIPAALVDDGRQDKISLCKELNISEKLKHIESNGNNVLDDLLGGLTFPANEDSSFSSVPEQTTKKNSIAFDILDLDLSISENVSQEPSESSIKSCVCSSLFQSKQVHMKMIHMPSCVKVRRKMSTSLLGKK